jgi:hypothetical protein
MVLTLRHVSKMIKRFEVGGLPSMARPLRCRPSESGLSEVVVPDAAKQVEVTRVSGRNPPL